jgi:hypothetical protein
MPLPPITQPSGLPPYLIAGHSTIWQSPFVDLVFCTGHRRRRRVVTRQVQTYAVSQILERDQMAAFQRWFRDTLRGGERRFSANVKEQGAGMLWYDAAFLQMPTLTAMHLGRWQMDGVIEARGDGSITGPALGNFSTSVSIAFLGTARIQVDKLFHTSVRISLLRSLRFSTSVSIALEA